MKVDGADDVALLRDQLDGALLLLGLVVDAIEKAKTFDEVADALETVLTDQQDGVAMAREFWLLRESESASRTLLRSLVGISSTLRDIIDHQCGGDVAKLERSLDDLDGLRAGR